MKRVAFYINPHQGWLGGVTYYKNLFLALSFLSKKRFEYFIFMPQCAKEFNFELQCRENIIYDDAFLSAFGLTLKSYIAKYHIDILSHMSIFSDAFGIKVLNWIPDFQHKYLKEYFSQEELIKRDSMFELYAKYADTLVLSSYDAKNDFETFFPNYKNKAKVLQFVSSIDFNKLNKELSKESYSNEKFFFLPNQFWQHKNHITLFRAIYELKKRGVEVKLLCSGHMDDYRNAEHIDMLKRYITQHKLEDNIKLLGVISYDELYALMFSSIAVINPSHFEGWSTTVEECKTLEKEMILSDINVHKEQNAKAHYFAPNNYMELSDIMETFWYKEQDKLVLKQDELHKKLLKRLISFGENFEQILSDI